MKLAYISCSDKLFQNEDFTSRKIIATVEIRNNLGCRFWKIALIKLLERSSIPREMKFYVWAIKVEIK